MGRNKTAAAAALGGLVVATFLAGCGGASNVEAAGTRSPTLTATPTPKPRPIGEVLHANLSTCNVKGYEADDSGGMVIGDGGHSVTLSTRGEGLGGQGLFVPNEALCLLGLTGMPDSVKAEIRATRALDGMQHATWGPYKASWTYHPDNGLKVILTDQ